MMPYWKVKEAWIQALLNDPDSLPDGILDDLQRMIEASEKRIAESGGKEPLRSLLVGERERLQAFRDQIAGIPAPLLDSSGPAPPPAVADAESPDSASEERFYRISGKTEPEASQAEARPTPATLEPKGEGTEKSPRAPMTESRRTRDVSPQDRNRVIKIVREFPCFVGPDLKTYGPFAKEDIVALADAVSSILLEGKVGEMVRPAGEET